MTQLLCFGRLGGWGETGGGGGVPDYGKRGYGEASLVQFHNWSGVKLQV